VPHSPISFSLIMRVETLNHPGSFAVLTEAIHDAGGTISGLDMHAATKERVVRDVTINVPSDAIADDVRAAIEVIDGARIISASDATFLAHLGGKIRIAPKIPVKNRQDLSTVYTPGVARVSMAIAADPRKAFQVTIKRNTVAVVTDGTAVLVLGDIGPLGALPVMEGKAMLFRQFGDIDAFPICLDTKDVDEIVETVVRIAPVFGGINLEDISAPRCFEIEERLIEALDIPVMHDDQHGTAVAILAALYNAAISANMRLPDSPVVVAGSGAAGTATLKLLLEAGVRDVIPVERSREAAIDKLDRLLFNAEAFAFGDWLSDDGSALVTADDRELLKAWVDALGPPTFRRPLKYGKRRLSITWPMLDGLRPGPAPDSGSYPGQRVR